MGVLGLTPFLQRTCPEVIKQLPDRLRGLSGKTIVIDGTLITQRLHFAPAHHPHRHVLGWYRLLRELKDYGVRAICVFDGKERSVAKTGEVERRREAQRMAVARGSIESDRLNRLQKLVDLYDNLSTLKNSEREQATTLLQTLASKSQRVSWPPKLDTHLAQVDLPPSPDHLPMVEDIVRPSPQTKRPIADDTQIPSTTSSFKPDMTPETITTALSSLFLDFCHSIPRVNILSDPTLAPLSDEDTTETPSEYAMSKSQYQLTLDEGKLWDQLISSPTASSDESTAATTKASLMALTRKSGVMSVSYRRRTNPPSTQTYKESKEMLQAMGVPCVEPAGPFEAEALAASLVINGLADYVASEDTDVLIYEAPLLRNITNRQSPLTTLSGTDIQAVLQLDRARFIDFALLLGTDFSQRIKNVGPTRALKFIREHGSIERVLAHEKRYPPPRGDAQKYLEQVEVARLVFRTLPPVPHPELLKTRGGDDGIVAEILQRYGLHQVAMYDWDYGAALDGNYFEDDPSVW